MDVIVLCVRHAMVFCMKYPLAMLNFVAFHMSHLAFDRTGLDLDFEIGLDNFVCHISAIGRHLMQCEIDCHVVFAYMTK